jgi:F0F1-type ATP synthase assembly protein I
VNQSSLNRRLNYIFGTLLGTGFGFWLMRGFGLFTFVPGGIIWLLLLGAFAVAVFGYVQKRWWRF